MKCFNHQSNNAVAICKNCNKGLCIECAIDVGNGIACKGSCEAEVAAINKTIQQSRKAFSYNSKNYFEYAVWSALFGISFIVSSFFLTRLTAFLIFMGGLMMVGAIFFYWASKRYRE